MLLCQPRGFFLPLRLPARSTLPGHDLVSRPLYALTPSEVMHAHVSVFVFASSGGMHAHVSVFFFASSGQGQPEEALVADTQRQGTEGLNHVIPPSCPHSKVGTRAMLETSQAMLETSRAYTPWRMVARCTCASAANFQRVAVSVRALQGFHAPLQISIRGKQTREFSSYRWAADLLVHTHRLQHALPCRLRACTRWHLHAFARAGMHATWRSPISSLGTWRSWSTEAHAAVAPFCRLALSLASSLRRATSNSFCRSACVAVGGGLAGRWAAVTGCECKGEREAPSSGTDNAQAAARHARQRRAGYDPTDIDMSIAHNCGCL